jgi:hypothetical protein
LGVEPAVERGAIDLNIRMIPRQATHALGGCNNAKKADP